MAALDEDAPVAEPEGTWLLPGGFEVSRLRELFEGRGGDAAGELDEDAAGEQAGSEGETLEQQLSHVLQGYEATTVGGLVSEIAGHIPLSGEVVEDGPLRLEVVASTDRRVERVRVGLTGSLGASEPE